MATRPKFAKSAEISASTRTRQIRSRVAIA
jgi:hypothetical protein